MAKTPRPTKRVPPPPPIPRNPFRVVAFEVKDFKAIQALQLPLRHVSLVTGANSSGKSSALQALLLAIQSRDRFFRPRLAPINLNGDLVRLGVPEEVIRDGTDSFTLGFIVEISSATPAPHRCSITFRLAEAPELPDIALDDLTERGGGGRLRVMEVIVFLNRQEILRAEALQRNQDGDQLSGQPFDSVIVKASSAPELVGAELAIGGLRTYAFARRPIDLGSLTDVIETLMRHAGHTRGEPVAEHLSAIIRAIQRDRAGERGGRAGRLPGSDPLYAQLLSSEALIRWLSSLNPSQISDVAKQVWEVPATGRSRVEDLFLRSERSRPSPEELDLLVEVLGSARPRGLDPADISVEVLLAWMERAIDDFSRRARYVSGLRSEPSVLQPLGDGILNQPLGLRGEFIGSFLSRAGRSRSRIALPPPRTGNRVAAFPRARAVTVLSALTSWVKHLDIADGVQVIPAGKLGYRVELLMGTHWRDLTEIGVGASQILPVMALVLASPLNGTVILEQPELHLHPAVHSRLADFLCFARPDINLVIESHSEYILTRLRLRVAQRASDSVTPDQISICFAERGRQGTRFRHLDMNEYGDLTAWPAGFFDAGEKDNIALLRAIAARRREERGDATS